MVKNLTWVTDGTNVRDVKDLVGSVNFDVPHNACIYVRPMHVMGQIDDEDDDRSLSNAYQ